MTETLTILKADGTREPFKEEKLLRSLMGSGAPQELAEHVVREIVPQLQPNMRTKDIYKRAFSLLKSSETTYASRYSMKRALFDLGPTGYPFEDFVAELLRIEGYEVETQVTVQGRCVPHEIDVVAVRGDQRIGIEAKFHNKAGMTSDVKTALYVKARYDDILESTHIREQYTEYWLVTNTKFTSHALAFGMCAGLGMVSWLDPGHGTCLRDRVQAAGLHPISSLTTLTKREKGLLMNNNVVLCRSLRENEQALRDIALSQKKAARVMDEVARLCPLAP